jgi:ABC-2 type transport system ATP-binding protein
VEVDGAIHASGAAGAAMIELRNVVKRYGGFEAVKGVTLKVEAGEFFGFLGPNGAGKTTTIKMLTGLLAPTSGQCMIGGHDVHRDPERAKQILAYIPDQPYLYEKLSGREFLHFLGGIYGLSGDELRRRVGEAVEIFDLADFVDRRAEEFSQGMRQRIVIAGALLHRPRALVIDEPLVGLDPRGARLVKQALKKCAQEGTAVLMSTHLLGIVEELCDRIGIIVQGRIVHEQPLKNVGDLEPLFLSLTR